ncbi:general secretion pathway protein L [Asaia lannensis NBRC 102526]|nr:general secretion pathway protein L [Asaia lannensis NBRC 102526]
MAIGLFLHWWGRQLYALIPERFAKTVILPARPVMQVRTGPEGLTFFLHTDRETVPLTNDTGTSIGPREQAQKIVGKWAPAPRCILVLPEGQIMQRSVTLPLAAEHDLDAVLRFEMDRLTPFPADALFWAQTLLHRDTALNQIVLALWIAPRHLVDPVMDQLTSMGITPDWLENDHGSARIALLRQSAPLDRVKDPRFALPVMACVLLVVFLLVGAVHQSHRLAIDESRIAGLRTPALQASQLRRMIEEKRAGARLVQDARTRLGDPMQILSVLTELLPDDTFLTDLSLKQGQLLISGQSGEPASLIRTLSASPLLHNPVFVAPVTHLTGQTASLFSIRADIGKAAQPSAKGAAQ